ncbi:ATP-dependent helicase dcl2-1 [Aspergillus taichungensis]|uniref:ATP-dependent helicase dcl2-1 n=1 Tax=Aspergillus taichungensis TaxID=482145 RepID=A0A2J5HQZ0_9EURO|nr:ATP-dependent helicase dcl2-1 [Aspergillus taichungensis]
MASATIPASPSTAPLYKPRSYQVEMLEEIKLTDSVKMDTGSGKTHVALLRITRELESCNPQKLIWFLAPTVALCFQQHRVIVENLPAVRARTLTGLDKVELWTEQAIWDAVLSDMQVVVSTHAVLADAMTHGFVRITELGLIVFDEAHHCMRRHPANKIMQDFYHPTLAKLGRDSVPRILGLTASPVKKSSRRELLLIETNLDSVCKTPRTHRLELIKHVHRPQLQPVWYRPFSEPELGIRSETLRGVIHAWETLDIENDPYVKKLRQNPLEKKALQKVLLTRKTYCTEQLRRFVDKSRHIYEELGEWAANYFIYASIEQLTTRVGDTCLELDWTNEEKAYLIELMARVPVPDMNMNDLQVSAKFQDLIDFLDSAKGEDFSGIIFVKQRVTVSVMARLLSIHPQTRDHFRCAAYVGWSGGSRKDILGEFLSFQKQRSTLDEFKSGTKNLIVGTDVLEEGIDVSACSVVVCFDKPPNLKSFVQRRGRARRKESIYAIMLPVDDESADLVKWQELEMAMIEAYQDEQRKLQEALDLENMVENVKERFEVQSTGALLTADVAVAHLYHFCAVLPQQAYVDNIPEFSYDTNEAGFLKGTVTLPTCVNPRVRHTSGEKWWQTENAAMKEAAFQAYKALYHFGLVNDNLLPLTDKKELGLGDRSDMPSIKDALEQYDPWVDWAHSWSSPDVHQTRIVVRSGESGDHKLSMILTVPTVLPALDPMTLFWDSDTTYELLFEDTKRAPALTAVDKDEMGNITALYVQAASRQQLAPERDYIALFGPDLPRKELGTWLVENQGVESALDVHARQSEIDAMGVIRDQTAYNEPLRFKRWRARKDETPELECDALPRRRNFLKQQTLATTGAVDNVAETLQESPRKVRLVSADRCTIDRLPYSQSFFGLFVSAILSTLEAKLVATKLCETILRDIGFSGTQHVITAITTPSAQSLTNYQRYEFIGDTVLKFTASCQLFYQHDNWHEGYLSQGRDAIVQNSRLAQAALDTGLDAFIINKMFTPRKWAFPLISSKLQSTTATPTQRKLSTKVLADVVEALIGAAYLDGGFSKVHTCIRRFLPSVDIEKLDIPAVPLHLPPKPDAYAVDPRLEEHIGYSFTNPSLLVEAITHPSCQYDSFTQSYQRLEFLGDAVLDMIIVAAIVAHPVEIDPGEMTKIKHAVVNANFLAFLCMEFSYTQETTTPEISPAPSTSTSTRTPTPDITVRTSTTTSQIALWCHMRSQSPAIKAAREAALTRHTALHTEISTALRSSPSYPWLALSQLNADKFFSDIVESIMGAIFVDSGGALSQCEQFAERLGLMDYLRRVLSEGVAVVHPKNVAMRLAKSAVGFELRRVVAEGTGEASYRCVGRFKLNLNGEAAKEEEEEKEEEEKEEVVVVVEGCATGEEAEIRAALEVVGRLEGLMRRDGEDVVMEEGGAALLDEMGV